jgi:nucleoside-diphosphate-sugar epimerase
VGRSRTDGIVIRSSNGRVVINFVAQALTGDSLTVYGDGTQTRSFCYASDLIEGFIRLMASDYTHPVNIGNPGEYTISQLASAVKEMINPGSKIILSLCLLTIPAVVVLIDRVTFTSSHVKNRKQNGNHIREW